MCVYIYIYIHIHTYIHIYIYIHTYICATTDARQPQRAQLGRGDDMVGDPHRTRTSKFELLELKCLNSSFSSSLVYCT